MCARQAVTGAELDLLETASSYNTRLVVPGDDSDDAEEVSNPFEDRAADFDPLVDQWIPLTLWSWDRLLAAPGWRRALAFLPLYLLHVTGGTYLAYMIHIPMAIQLLCRLPRRATPDGSARCCSPRTG